MNGFDDKQTNLPAIRCKLYNLQQDLNALNRIPPKNYTTDLIRKKTDVMDQIQKLKDEIEAIENDVDILSYFGHTKDILESYYGNDFSESTYNTSNLTKKNVLFYLVSDEPQKTPNKPSKVQLYNQYLAATDYGMSNAVQDEIVCDCGGVMRPILNDGEVECEDCGLIETVLPTCEKPNYNEQVSDTNNYTYKRRNHLLEILSQIQAKETTDIPEEIIEDITQYCYSRNINIDTLKYHGLRKIMKAIKINNKYHEHAFYILQKLNGTEPPSLSRENEEKIKKMFEKAQIPFMKYCPPERKNFMKYYFFLHKVCELLELDDLIQYFPLLKNNQKLAQHDKIWKCICDEVHWQYIKSI